MLDWCCIAAVNNEEVFVSNLAASPMIVAEPLRLTTLRNQQTAGAAYNTGLDRTEAAVCIFAHQDVYLPADWITQLSNKIDELEIYDPCWAIAGVFGISSDFKHVGRVWSSGLGREIGVSPSVPVPVQSIDELVIIVNRASGLRFDADLPSFHLYGTDIVQMALAQGCGAYVIDAPVVHNSIPVTSLRGDFMLSHTYMRHKWRDCLPIQTSVTHITPLGLKTRWQILRKSVMGRLRTIPRSSSCDQPRPDPVEIAKRLGYESKAAVR